MHPEIDHTMLSTSEHVARKSHGTCPICREEIRKDQRYTRHVGIEDGEFYVHKQHAMRCWFPYPEVDEAEFAGEVRSVEEQRWVDISVYRELQDKARALKNRPQREHWLDRLSRLYKTKCVTDCLHTGLQIRCSDNKPLDPEAYAKKLEELRKLDEALGQRYPRVQW